MIDQNIREELELLKKYPELAEMILKFWLKMYAEIAVKTLVAWWYIIAIAHVLEGVFLNGS